jgi:hypothetical protein
MLQSKLIAGLDHFCMQKTVNNAFARCRQSNMFLTDFS